MTEAATSLRRGRAVIALLIGVVAIVGAGRTAAAHTDFHASTPTDGAVVEGPLTEIVVAFTNPAEPAGDGFQLLDPTGTVLTPTSIDPTDGTSFVLGFDPPLTPGTYGVRWSVRAGDAHPIEGSFSFEVTGPTPTTEPATTTDPTGTEPAAGATASIPSTTMPMVEHMADMDLADRSAMSENTLEAFLDVGTATTDSVKIGRAGRAVTMLGLVFGVGVLAALAWTIRGRREELVAHLDWIRLAGLVVLTGGFVEYASLAEADPSFSFGSLTSTKGSSHNSGVTSPK
jgi:methionine-rich copper-binding protein CopC